MDTNEFDVPSIVAVEEDIANSDVWHPISQKLHDGTRIFRNSIRQFKSAASKLAREAKSKAHAGWERVRRSSRRHSTRCLSKEVKTAMEEVNSAYSAMYDGEDRADAPATEGRIKRAEGELKSALQRQESDIRLAQNIAIAEAARSNRPKDVFRMINAILGKVQVASGLSAVWVPRRGYFKPTIHSYSYLCSRHPEADSSIHRRPFHYR